MAGGIFGGGNGNIDNPFLVEDAEDLNRIRALPNSHFKLVANINLGVAPYNSGNGWTPIKNFTGSLNGNDMKIYNLFINRPAESNVGLFGEVSLSDKDAQSMAIYDLSVEDVNIVGQDYVGAICGSIKSAGFFTKDDGKDLICSLTRLAASGTITARQHVGGIVGRYEFSPATFTSAHYLMENCMVEVKFILSKDGNFCSQLIGSTKDILSASEAAGGKFVMYGCVGISYTDFSQATPKNIGYGTITKSIDMKSCFYDKTRWPEIKDVTSKNETTLLSTDDMKSVSGVNLDQPRRTKDLTRIWSVQEGRYPELRCKSPDYLYVCDSGKYYAYDEIKKEWTVQHTSEPSILQAQRNAMRQLDSISIEAWTFFKSKPNAYIVNISDKTNNNTSVKSYAAALLKDTANSTEAKSVFRKKIDFNFDGGVLAAIKL